MSDRVEKKIELKAPVEKVWSALTDSQKFGEWFRVKLEGPFAVGEAVSGKVLYPGYEHLKFEVVVKAIEPRSLFSYTWHPYAIDPKVDYTQEAPTLVEFRLEPVAEGTMLGVTESGFDKLPSERRLEAFRMNDNGWGQQMKNIEAYLAKAE